MSTQLRRIQKIIGSGILAFLIVSASPRTAKADIIFDVESVVSGTFGTLDADTGVFTSISTGDPIVAGLGQVAGVLYGGDYQDGGQLYSIDQVTGVFTPIGDPTGVSYYDFGSTTNSLFAVDPAFNLYSIDAGTGAATQIGALDVPLCGASQLSTNSSTLYLTECGNLYTVDTATATPTLIGPTGSYDALSVLEGVLYGAGPIPGTIDTVDPLTGTFTPGLAITGTPDADTAIFGMAPANVVPEPGDFLLLCSAIAVFPLLRRRRKA